MSDVWWSEVGLDTSQCLKHYLCMEINAESILQLNKQSYSISYGNAFIYPYCCIFDIFLNRDC